MAAPPSDAAGFLVPWKCVARAEGEHWETQGLCTTPHLGLREEQPCINLGKKQAPA